VHTRKSRTVFFLLEGLNATAMSYFASYVFFLLRDRFGLGNLGNFSIAAAGGFVYIFAAWQGGRFAQRFGYFTSLRLGFAGMAACMALGATFSSLPATVLAYVGWMASMCFTWPAIEALISDGIDDRALPRNIGLFNVIWAAIAAAVYFVGGKTYETLGQQSLFWLPALLYLVQLAIVVCLGKNPIHVAPAAPTMTHPVESAAFHQPVTPQTFLRMAWLAIPFSYMAITTVFAVIPALAKTLELSTAEAGCFCSIWLFARLATFAALWFWPGWHYRFRWLLAAFVGLTASFGILLTSHNYTVLVAAQTVFGVAIGLIYYSSLFYSMDVGETKGEHGGLHEAMIGAGNCLGPAVGVLGLCLAPGNPNAGAYAVTALLTCGLAGLIALRLRRADSG
jgi:predicted MFS family arabinose efflux permease